MWLQYCFFLIIVESSFQILTNQTSHELFNVSENHKFGCWQCDKHYLRTDDNSYLYWVSWIAFRFIISNFGRRELNKKSILISTKVVSNNIMSLFITLRVHLSASPENDIIASEYLHAHSITCYSDWYRRQQFHFKRVLFS